MKAIVIGIMDRLSAYASREADSETPEERLRKEQEAAQRLLEKLSMKDTETGEKLEKLASSESYTMDGPRSDKSGSDDGTQDSKSEGASTPKPTEEEAGTKTPTDAKEESGQEKPTKGIPDDIKLYEIFYEQVLNLVNVRAHTRQFGHSSAEPRTDFYVSSKAQNLPIQDVIALLVSLANLALKIYPERLGT